MWTGLIDQTTLYRAVRLDVERYDKRNAQTVSAGRGSGFLIDAELGDNYERASFLVTNRHMMDPNFGPSGKIDQGQGALTVSGYMQPSRGYRFPSPKFTKIIIPEPDPKFPSDPRIDLAVIRFDPGTGQVVDGSGAFNTFKEHDIATPWAYAEGEIYAGTQVLMAGYPAFDGQSDVVRPILVGGIVSSDPRFSAELEGITYPGSALCHAFSRAGMSGAPVLAAVLKEPRDKNALPEFQLRVIGVNAGHLHGGGSSNGVLSHFVTSIALLEMLAEEGSSGARDRLFLENVWGNTFDDD